MCPGNDRNYSSKEASASCQFSVGGHLKTKNWHLFSTKWQWRSGTPLPVPSPETHARTRAHHSCQTSRKDCCWSKKPNIATISTAAGAKPFFFLTSSHAWFFGLFHLHGRVDLNGHPCNSLVFRSCWREWVGGEGICASGGRELSSGHPCLYVNFRSFLDVESSN